MTDIKTKKPTVSFSRGSISYILLAILIGAALLFGVFERKAPSEDNLVIGSYGEYDIIANKQGMNVFEVKLQNKDQTKQVGEIEITNIKNVMWIVAQTYKIQSFHPIEEGGKTYGLIVTVEDE